MREKLQTIENKYDELTKLLMDPQILSNPTELQKYSKEQADLQPLVDKIRDYNKLLADIEGAEAILREESGDLRELAQAELEELSQKIPVIEQELKIMLLPKDPRDERNVILEIRAGTGGEEAALFGSNLLKMYLKYAEQKKWKIEMIDMNATGLGGIKEVTVSILGKNAYSRLKYESGVHRVQRVPVTEGSGRIHTSAATVAVLPEAADVDVRIEDKDLRIDTYCSSGPGGQGVNTTYSAVRIVHVPTGLVVQCQDERSQIKNKEKAMKVLRARLFEIEMERQENERAQERKSQVGTGDRSEKIRTYNFPQNRVTDHRIGLTLYRLPDVLDGDLDLFIDDLIVHAQAEQLEA